MSASAEPTPRPPERELRPRRAYRAVPMVLAVVLLAINLGLTARIVWRLERQPEPAPQPQPLTLPDILAALARSGKGREEKQRPAAGKEIGFAFDSIAVMPFPLDDEAMKEEKSWDDAARKAAREEAAKIAPALAGLLNQGGNLRVVPADQVAGLKESDPVKVGRALKVQAVLSGKFSIARKAEGALSAQLLDVTTGLTLWQQRDAYVPSVNATSPAWKETLTKSLVTFARGVQEASTGR